MKNLIVILLVVLSLNVYSQVGFKTGLSIDNTPYESVITYNYGVFTTMNHGNYKIGTGINYIKKGMLVVDNNTYSTSYIQLPVSLILGEQLYFLSGVAFSYPLKPNNLELSDSKYIIGIQSGVGYNLQLQNNFVNLETKIIFNQSLIWHITIGYGINLQK